MACFEFYAGLGEQLDSSREKDVDVGDSSFRYLLYMSLLHTAPCNRRPLFPKLPPGSTVTFAKISWPSWFWVEREPCEVEHRVSAPPCLCRKSAN